MTTHENYLDRFLHKMTSKQLQALAQALEKELEARKTTNVVDLEEYRRGSQGL